MKTIFILMTASMLISTSALGKESCEDIAKDLCDPQSVKSSSGSGSKADPCKYECNASEAVVERSRDNKRKGGNSRR